MNFLFDFGVSFKGIRARATREIISLMPKNFGAENHEATRHLVNLTPTDLALDSDGNKVMGKFLANDLTVGTESPLVWSFAADIIVWSSLAFFALAIAGFFGLWMSVSVVSANTVGGIQSVGWRVVAMLPFFAGMFVFAQFMKSKAQGLWLIAAVMSALAFVLTLVDTTGPVIVKTLYFNAFLNIFGAAPLAVAMLALYCVLADGDPSASLARKALAIGVAVLVMVVFVPFLGSLVGLLVAVIMPFVTPLMIKRYIATRKGAIADAAHELAEKGVNADFKTSEEKRREQVECSIHAADTEGDVLIELGVAKGVVRALGEPLSPDEFDVFHIPYRAWDTHLRIFGKSGIGKTTILQRIISQIARISRENGRMVILRGVKKTPFDRRECGMFIADGKAGSLPRQMHEEGLLDYLIDPNDPSCPKINLGSLLPPGKIGSVYKTVFGSEGADGQVWESSASSYIDFSATLVHYAMMVLGQKVTQKRIRDACLRPKYREKLIEICNESIDPKPEDLINAINAWVEGFNNLPPATAQSVMFTLQSWFNQLSSNPALNILVDGEGDVDIVNDCLTGKYVGVALSETDGIGGALALNMLTRAINEKILADRNGKKNWKANGIWKDLHFIFDEASIILDEGIVKTAAMGRSVGLKLTLVFQSVHQVYARLGEVEGDAILDNIQSVITFGSSTSMKADSATVSTYNHVASLTGVRHRVVRDGVDISSTESLSDAISAQRSDGRLNRSEGSLLEMVSSITTSLAEARRAFSFGGGERQAESLDAMTRRRKARGRIQLMESVSSNDLAQNLGAKHQAFALVSIHGTPRMDFIDARPGVIDAPESVARRDPMTKLARMPWLSAIDKPPTKREREKALRLASSKKIELLTNEA